VGKKIPSYINRPANMGRVLLNTIQVILNSGAQQHASNIPDVPAPYRGSLGPVLAL
jgi:hypothetical protein